jgi:hypothetical protein
VNLDHELPKALLIAIDNLLLRILTKHETIKSHIVAKPHSLHPLFLQTRRTFHLLVWHFIVTTHYMEFLLVENHKKDNLIRRFLVT